MSRFALDLDWCAQLVTALLHSIWQAPLIALVSATILQALPQARAQTRYLVLVVSLLLVALCVPLTLAVLCLRSPSPAEQAAIYTAVNARIENEFPPAADVAENPIASSNVAPNRAGNAGSGPAKSILRETAPWALLFYTACVSLMLAQTCLALRGGQRLVLRSTPIADVGLLSTIGRAVKAMGFSFNPAVATCAHLSVPAVVGVLRPMLILPISAASGLPPGELELLVMHELAHICRHDQVINLFQRLIEAFLFFNPAVWFLTWQIRAEREKCCDDTVVRVSGRKQQYAESLVNAAALGMLVRRVEPALLAATGSRPSELRQRVARLVRPTAQPGLRLTRGSALAVGGVTAMALVVPLLLVVKILPANVVPPVAERLAQQLESRSRMNVSPANAADVAQWTLLHRAVAYGSAKEVSMLLVNNADPNVRIKGGWTPLHLAASFDRVDVVEMLLRAGANPNAVNDQRRAPLHIAAGLTPPLQMTKAGPRPEIARLLLAAHADPDAKDEGMLTPIHCAILVNSWEMLDLLAKAHAQIDARDVRGCTPLHYACDQGAVSLIEDLLARGADAKATDKREWTTLDHLAFQIRHKPEELEPSIQSAAKKLLAKGASLDLASATALGFVDSVKGELDQDPSRVNELPSPTFFGRYLLHWATASGNDQMCALLLNYEPDVNVRAENGRTPLLLMLARSQADPDTVQRLVKAGANVNTVDKQKISPLHLAAMLRDPKIVDLLIKAGAKSMPDLTGRTPLHLLADPRSVSGAAEVQVAELLIPTQADINAPDANGLTALHMASIAQRADLAVSLLDHGANANAQDSQGRTPLLIALLAESADPKLVKALLDHAADPNIKDNGGRSAAKIMRPNP